MKQLVLSALLLSVIPVVYAQEQTTNSPTTTEPKLATQPTKVEEPQVVSQTEVQPHHIFSIGTDGFGWSGVANVFNWDEQKSKIDEHETSHGEIQLNYRYVLDTRFMLGVSVASENDKSEIKKTSGSKITEDEINTELGFIFGYNFDEDIRRSWWVEAILGHGQYENETKDEDGKTKFDYDYNFFGIQVGKRISLESWGLKAVSYNPSIGFLSATVSGDAKDAGLDTVNRVILNIIKIDILF